MNCRYTILILLLLGAMCERSPAPLYQDGYSDAAARALAGNYSNAVGRLSLYLNGTGAYDVSGVFLNSRCFATAAHSIINPIGAGNATIMAVYQGTVPGGPPKQAQTLIVYPGYASGGATPDLAIIILEEDVPALTLPLTSASAGAVVTSVGFGYFGTPSTGLSTQDNHARGWQATISSSTYGGFSGVYYQSSLFDPYEGLSLNGRGVGGDSGSPVFNSSGQLVGITVAAGGGLTPIGDTTFLRLTQPEVFNWIQSIITPVEPQIVSLAPEGFNLRLTWQGKGGSNYVVQAASALGGTNTFTDLSASISLPGVGPVLTNFLDVGVLTNHTTRFYRLRLSGAAN